MSGAGGSLLRPPSVSAAFRVSADETRVAEVTTDPPLRRQRVSFDERHLELLDIAEELYAQHGYAAVGIEDIARGAGVTRPTIYRHFQTREQVYLECVARARQVYQQKQVERMAQFADPMDRLRAGADVFFGMLENEPDRWRLVFGGSVVLPGEYTEALAQMRFDTIEQTRLLLHSAMPDAPPDDVEALAHAASGIAERLGHWWLTRPDKTREEVIDRFVAICLNGAAPYLPQR